MKDKKRRVYGDDWQTYEEWRRQGRQVKKGQQATRAMGQVLFHSSQTKPRRGY